MRLNSDPVGYLNGMKRDLDNFVGEFQEVVELFKGVYNNPDLPELQEAALVNYLKECIESYEHSLHTQQMDFYSGYRRGMYVTYREILSMLRPETEGKEIHREKPTSEQLVEQFDAEDTQDITIMGDIVHGLDFEYKTLEEKVRMLKQGIKNTFETGQEIMAEQQEVIDNVYKDIQDGRSIEYIRDKIISSVSSEVKGGVSNESEEGN